MSSLDRNVYVPCGSLNEEDLQSLLRLARSKEKERVDLYGGRKVALMYLLFLRSLHYQFPMKIESNEWKSFEKLFEKLKPLDYSKEEFSSKNDVKVEGYWELNSESSLIHPVAKQSRRFHQRALPFDDRQLKIYFNIRQIENIPYSTGTYQSSGFLDEDCRENLLKYPLKQRNNPGRIETVQGRVENVIFQVPPNKQIIILDFADERMPGGLFLYGATTQEETICYHSELYRAILDLKYQRFHGGFFIPEYGCLYFKEIAFSHPPSYDKFLSIDIIAGACYDLTGQHGLHLRPATDELLYQNTKKKFRTIIGSAQVNAKANGSNTYLILGPIGCGAFQNDLRIIARLWYEVLSETLDPSTNTKVSNSFERIWFIAGNEEKLKVFHDVFHLD